MKLTHFLWVGNFKSICNENCDFYRQTQCKLNANSSQKRKSSDAVDIYFDNYLSNVKAHCAAHICLKQFIAGNRPKA